MPLPAHELLKAGKLGEAIQAVTAEIRANPGDLHRRTFLFELLCFAGQYDRADQQLELLGEGSGERQIGALLYRAALQAERTRHDLFRNRQYPAASAEAPEVAGVLNGKSFQALTDADPRIGPRLEIFAAGTYMWIPWEHVASLEIPPPRRLRDLLWTPATLRTGPGFQNQDLGEVLLPVLSPFSWQHADEAVRLGRVTVWEEETFGQKTLLVDDEEVPLLEVRKLEIQAPAAAS